MTSPRTDAAARRLRFDVMRVAIDVAALQGAVEQASRLKAIGAELERLAGEFYNLADEADDPFSGPLPGFDT